ncbi:hypothetical protein D3C77_774460 [compost metagenome]
MSVSVHKDFELTALWQYAHAFAFLHGFQESLYSVGFQLDGFAKRGLGVPDRDGRVEQVL